MSNFPGPKTFEPAHQSSTSSNDEYGKSMTLPVGSLESSSIAESECASSICQAATATEKPIVSPLSAATNSVKTKLNRKTLNKLKRKRLEESKSCRTVKVSFSGKNLSCFGEPITGEGRGILYSLRLGTLFAHEFVSLDPREGNRWTLKSFENKSFMHHPSIPQEIFESIRGREPTFFLYPNQETSQNSVTIESLAHMLVAMNAALIMSCFDRHREASYYFLLVPHQGNKTKVLGVACVWSNFPAVQQDEERSTSSSSQDHMSCLSNSNVSKKLKVDSEMESRDSLNENCSKQSEKIAKPFTWNDLVELYDQCVSQKDGAPLPIEFAREKLYAAVITLWNGEHCTNTKLEQLKALFDLLRSSNGNMNDKGILITKNELSDAIKARRSVDEDPNGRFVTLILMQILIRVQLLSMHNENDDERNGFLEIYSKINRMHSCTKVSIKKKKRSKIYTLDDFSSELCSLAEMLPFTLPSPSNFPTFFSQEVLKPCQVVMPSLVASISDYFELDISEQTAEGIVEADDSASNRSQLLSDDVATQKGKLISRWSKSIPHKQMELSTKGQETRQKMKVPQESEEKILFENKFDITVKTKIHNPLLSDNKGRYVGRQFSGNYFREIKAIKPKPVVNVKPTQKDKDTSLLRSEEYKRPQPVVSETPQRKNHMKNILSGPLNSAISLPLMTGKSGSRLSSIFHHGEESNTDSCSAKAKHPHAAVMKALAVMRKRR